MGNIINTIREIKFFGLIMSLDGTILFANQYAHDILGYEMDELNGKDFFTTLLPKEEQEERRISFSNAIQNGGLFDKKVRHYITKNGANKWVEVASTVVSEMEGAEYLTIIGEDISEKKSVEEALNKSNAQLQDLIDNTSDLIFISGISGRFLFVNKAFVETMGYSEEELKALKIQDVLHPEFAYQTEEYFKKLNNKESLGEFTGVFRRKDGRRLYLSGSVTCRFEKGIPSAYRCILHDSTSRIRAERAQKLYSSISTVAMAATNLDDLYKNIHEELGKVIDVKNFFIAQYDPKTSLLYFPYYEDEHFDPNIHFIKRKLGNGLTEYAIAHNGPLILHDEDILKLHEEKKIYYYGTVPKVILTVPLKVGDRVTGIIGVKSYERNNKYENRDLDLLNFISRQVAIAIERKQSEEALARETARLNAIFESSSHLMWSVNTRLLLTFFNQNYSDLLNNYINRRPAIGLKTENLGFKLFANYERQKLAKHYSDAFKGEKQHFEVKISGEDKEERWLEVFLNPIANSEGKIDEVSGIAKDITELKKYQSDLVVAREEAEHSLKVKEQFLANMSHEIRTPMNGVIGMTDLLAQTKLDSSQADFVDTIKKSSEALLHILNDILDFAKIEAGKMVLNPVHFSLEKLLDRLIVLFSQVAKSKNNQLSYHIDPKIPKILFGDEIRLLQVLSNLTSNALKFTERGQVEIRLTASSIHAKKVEILFEVIDTGVGISKEDLQKLFNSFQQLDNSTKKVHGGTGLGLAISKEFVRLMEGDIYVQSQPGEGSNFHFSIQLEKGDEKQINSSIESHHIPFEQFDLEGVKILLVDDNPTNRKVASKILQQAKASVIEADSGFSALAICEKEQNFDIILMDIQMPEMDGIETTQKLRANHAQLPPVIAMTAYAMKQDQENFLSNGLDYFLPKPIRAEALLGLIADLTNRALKKAHEKRVKKIPAKVHYLDSSILDSLASAVGGDFEMVEEMIFEFISEAMEQLKGADLAVKSNNCKEAQAELHTLKGNSGTFGAMPLFELLQSVEGKAKKCDFEKWNQELPELKKLLNNFESEAKTYFKKKMA